MKTARFSTVVAKAGKPQHHLAWGEPEDDPALTKSVRQNRLLSVRQQVRGAKADYASVGLEVGRNTQYFIFPRSLKAFAGSRIIAINYDLTDEKISAGPAPKPNRLKHAATSKIVPFPERPNPVATPPKKSPPKPAAVAPRKMTLVDLRHEIRAALGELHKGRTDLAGRRLTDLLSEKW